MMKQTGKISVLALSAALLLSSLMPVQLAGASPVSGKSDSGVSSQATVTAVASSTRLLAASSHPARLCLDMPGSVYLTDQSALAGWALNASGVKSIKIYVDGTYRASTQADVTRPDVDTTYPGYPGGANSGFSYNLSGLFAGLGYGKHSLYVVAVGNDGSQQRSNTITVSKNRPALFVDSPGSNSAVSGAFSVNGWALGWNGIAAVRVFLDGNSQIGSGGTGVYRPDVANSYAGSNQKYGGYSISIDINKVPTGSHRLVVRAYEPGGTYTETAVPIRVTKPAPAICVDTPSGFSVTDASVFKGWTINASGVSYVAVYIDGVQRGTTQANIARPDIAAIAPQYPNSANAGFSFELSPMFGSLGYGSHQVYAVAVGNDGDKAKSRPITVTKSRPVVTVDSPSGNATVGNVFPVSGWALGWDGIGSVRVYVDGNKLVGSGATGLSRPDVANFYKGTNQPNAGFSVPVNLRTVPVGSHQLTVRAYAKDGTYSDRIISIRLAKPTPYAHLDMPSTVTLTENSTVNGWAVNDSGVSNVTIYVDGVARGTTQANLSRDDVATSYPNYSNAATSGFSCRLSPLFGSLSYGSHKVYIVAVGADGSRAQSGTVTVVKSHIAMNVDAPYTNQVVKPNDTLSVGCWAINWNGICEVGVSLDGHYVATLNPDQASPSPDIANYFAGSKANNARYNFSISTAGWSNGRHTLAVVVWDGQGGVQVRQISIIVGNMQYDPYTFSLSAIYNSHKTDADLIKLGMAQSITLSDMDPTAILQESYGIYQFMNLDYIGNPATGQGSVPVSVLNAALQGKGVLNNCGQAFDDACAQNNINPIYFVAHTFLETANGTSTLAKGRTLTKGSKYTSTVGVQYVVDATGASYKDSDGVWHVAPGMYYNLFGIGTYDNSLGPNGTPDYSREQADGFYYAASQNWNSVGAAIAGAASWISYHYIHNSQIPGHYDQDTLYEMKWDPQGFEKHGVVGTEYATDHDWADGIAQKINTYFPNALNQYSMYFEIPQFAN